jgi:hypothetical protein
MYNNQFKIDQFTHKIEEKNILERKGQKRDGQISWEGFHVRKITDNSIISAANLNLNLI